MHSSDEVEVISEDIKITLYRQVNLSVFIVLRLLAIAMPSRGG